MPDCAGVTRFRSREDARAFRARLAADGVFPPAFDLDAPVCPYLLGHVMHFAGSGPDIRALKAPPVASALVRRLYRDLAGDKPVVAITLRQSDFQPQRNSRMDQWLALAASCRERGLFPLFVPDSEAVLAGVRDRSRRRSGFRAGRPQHRLPGRGLPGMLAQHAGQ